MSVWRVLTTDEAEEDLDVLDSVIRRRVLGKLVWLQDNFDNIIPIPLGAGWRGFFKLRLGDWRVIYEVDILKNEIIIHRAGHRSQVYK